MALIIVDQEVGDEVENWEANYKRYFKIVDGIWNEENVGVPIGYNQGIQVALTLKPKYIIIMNNDIEVLPNWYTELKRCAEKDPKIGIVGGKSLPYGDNPNRPSYHGGIIVFTDGRIIGKPIEVPLGAPDLNIDVENFCVGFACALVKTQLFRELGLFDENYSPCDYEDTDFCFRARDAGWKVISCIPCKYFHLEGATIKAKKFKIPWDKNRKYFVSKWRHML